MAARSHTAQSSRRAGSLAAYDARRDFAATPEPRGAAGSSPAAGGRCTAIFVVQEHHARRLHWDFRLEQDGALWSWAVPKGPSMDPADKRLAVRTEDHPLDYARFSGTIPAGQYGAGHVAVWDHGTWQPQGDAQEGLAAGELKFSLRGERLNGRFVLVRLKPRGREKAENWLLIKEHDPPAATQKADPADEAAEQPAAPDSDEADAPPAPGAVRAPLPRSQRPQLATAVSTPPENGDWLSEIKFDGYRVIAFKRAGRVRLMTRNGLDWTERLPRVAAAIGRLPARQALLDGELVAPGDDGVADFADLQQALAEGRDRALVCYLFDLLHLDGWDLRPCRLIDRKAALARLLGPPGTLRYSDHMAGVSPRMQREACGMGLEGLVCKQADAPYRAGRGPGWVKLKCLGREEFLVLGWTPPAGRRQGLGALQLGYRDPSGALHFAGGVGTGFTDADLGALRRRLEELAADAPAGLHVADPPPDAAIRWVRPELVGEIRYTGWSGGGRLRHAAWLGLRDDKAPDDVVRPVADPGAPRHILGSSTGAPAILRSRRAAAPAPEPERRATATPAPRSRVATAPAPRSRVATAPAQLGAAEVVQPSGPATRPQLGAATILRPRRQAATLSHPDRALWPGVTKADLAAYWQTVAEPALAQLAGRPLALVRCPDGVAGQHFFQKHAHRGLPAEIREGAADGAPYLAIDDAAGLVAATQIAALEVHAWGAREPDVLHPDRLVFDLDPDEGLPFARVVAAAREVRARLERQGLASFCRTTGGKGLHVVVPLRPQADWDTARAFCKAFAEAMVAEAPDRYVAKLAKAARHGRILVDWLRNGLGATAVASFSPRARPGALVATPLAWREVTDRLDRAAFTTATVPVRLRRQRRDPWEGFAACDQVLP